MKFFYKKSFRYRKKFIILDIKSKTCLYYNLNMRLSKKYLAEKDYIIFKKRVTTKKRTPKQLKKNLKKLENLMTWEDPIIVEESIGINSEKRENNSQKDEKIDQQDQQDYRIEKFHSNVKRKKWIDYKYDIDWEDDKSIELNTSNISNISNVSNTMNEMEQKEIDLKNQSLIKDEKSTIIIENSENNNNLSNCILKSKNDNSIENDYHKNNENSQKDQIISKEKNIDNNDLITKQEINNQIISSNNITKNDNNDNNEVISGDSDGDSENNETHETDENIDISEDEGDDQEQEEDDEDDEDEENDKIAKNFSMKNIKKMIKSCTKCSVLFTNYEENEIKFPSTYSVPDDLLEEICDSMKLNKWPKCQLKPKKHIDVRALSLKPLIVKFWNIENLEFLCKILLKKVPITLTDIDWLCIGYGIEYPVKYSVMRDGKQFLIDVGEDHKLNLCIFNRKHFGAFCRYDRILIAFTSKELEKYLLPEKNDGNIYWVAKMIIGTRYIQGKIHYYLITSVGQLLFFRWAFLNNVVKYCQDNIQVIHKHLKIAKSQPKEDGKRRRLSHPQVKLPQVKNDPLKIMCNGNNLEPL